LGAPNMAIISLKNMNIIPREIFGVHFGYTFVENDTDVRTS